MNDRLKKKLKRELTARAEDNLDAFMDEYGFLKVDEIVDVVEEVMDGKTSGFVPGGPVARERPIIG